MRVQHVFNIEEEEEEEEGEEERSMMMPLPEQNMHGTVPRPSHVSHGIVTGFCLD